ncbi:hypothetical protein SPD48_09270 [Pseudogracilibacillus sp. SE30717A]|uniref:hypothetical protein n=1 Tax=Pseudogracilibacillus sp. SE30717A TaxID=3098293 RepID=UPI00300E014E
MEEHVTEAIDFYLSHGFVTECDFSFIGSRPLFKNFGHQLESRRIEYMDSAIEIKGQFLYFIYNPSEFPVFSEMKDFITQYMEQRSYY